VNPREAELPVRVHGDVGWILGVECEWGRPRVLPGAIHHLLDEAAPVTRTPLIDCNPEHGEVAVGSVGAALPATRMYVFSADVVPSGRRTASDTNDAAASPERHGPSTPRGARATLPGPSDLRRTVPIDCRRERGSRRTGNGPVNNGSWAKAVATTSTNASRSRRPSSRTITSPFTVPPRWHRGSDRLRTRT